MAGAFRGFTIKANQAAYMDSFEIYSKIYPALKSVYDFSASKGF